MKTTTLLLSSLLAASLAAPAFAAPKEGAREPTPQQQRMKNCNAEAKSKALKGSERRSFMSTCLKGHPTAAATSETASEKQATR